MDAFKHCENDAYVQMAAAEFFWDDRKIPKARKWLQRAITLAPKNGDAWGMALAFELANGSLHEQREIIAKCADADPNKG